MRHGDRADHKKHEDAGADAADAMAGTDRAGEEDLTPDIASLAADIGKRERELESLREDAAKSQDQYLRALADFDNFRKRQREETARRVMGARQELLLKLLPVIDNLERALASAEQGHSYDTLVEGVSLTLRQMQDTLAAEGVQAIEAVGEQFDPELHEAMMRVDTDEYPENTIVDELEKGYTLDGKILRPSRVRVAIPSPGGEG